MDINEPTTIYISTQPTAKDVLIQTGIGIGASLAVLALTGAAFAIAGAVAQKIEARKEAKKNSQTDNV